MLIADGIMSKKGRDNFGHRGLRFSMTSIWVNVMNLKGCATDAQICKIMLNTVGWIILTKSTHYLTK